jgi:hypothetical protein
MRRVRRTGTKPVLCCEPSRASYLEGIRMAGRWQHRVSTTKRLLKRKLSLPSRGTQEDSDFVRIYPAQRHNQKYDGSSFMDARPTERKTTLSSITGHRRRKGKTTGVLHRGKPHLERKDTWVGREPTHENASFSREDLVGKAPGTGHQWRFPAAFPRFDPLL